MKLSTLDEGEFVVTGAGNILSIQAVDGGVATFTRVGVLQDGAPALFINQDWWGECSWRVECFADARRLSDICCP